MALGDALQVLTNLQKIFNRNADDGDGKPSACLGPVPETAGEFRDDGGGPGQGKNQQYLLKERHVLIREFNKKNAGEICG